MTEPIGSGVVPVAQARLKRNFLTISKNLKGYKIFVIVCTVQPGRIRWFDRDKIYERVLDSCFVLDIHAFARAQWTFSLF